MQIDYNYKKEQIKLLQIKMNNNETIYNDFSLKNLK